MATETSSDQDPSGQPDPLAKTFLGPEGEDAYRLLLRALDWGEGFELHLVLSPSNLALETVMARLRALPAYQKGRYVIHEKPEALIDLPALLIEEIPAELETEPGITPVAILAKGSPAELEAAWCRAAGIINEHRNRLVKVLPRPILFLGPPALIDWLRFSAPDLWSIHARIFDLPQPPASPESMAAMRDMDSDERIRRTDERDADYYLDLAEEFKHRTRKREVRSYLGLLIKAVKADLNQRIFSRAQQNVEIMLDQARRLEL